MACYLSFALLKFYLKSEEFLQINYTAQLLNSAFKPVGYRLSKPANFKMFHFLFQSKNRNSIEIPEADIALTPLNQASNNWECPDPPSLEIGHRGQ